MTAPELVPDHLLGKVCIGNGVGVAIVGTGLYPELGDLNDSVVRFLMCLRGELRTHDGGPGVRNEPNCWDLPGGGVDFGELIEDAAKREVLEELGLVLPDVRYIGHLQHIIRDQAGRPVEHWISHTHLATIAPGSLAPAVPPEESSKIVRLRYMTLAEISRAHITSSMVKAYPQLVTIRF